MSAFTPLKNATVTVKRRTGRDNDGDPSYGSPQEVDVRLKEGGTIVRDGEGNIINRVDKITTDDFEFKEDDAIWLPGADTSNTAEAITPESVGFDTTDDITVYKAEF